MSALENLTCPIKAGDTLKPWLMLGPFNHDMSSKGIGLSYFENQSSQVGRAAMNEIFDWGRPAPGAWVVWDADDPARARRWDPDVARAVREFVGVRA